MSAPSLGKNEEKGKIINFKELDIPINEEEVFIHKNAIDIPHLIPNVCRNEGVDMVELCMKSPALQDMSCPVRVQNIQTHQANGPWILQTRMSQPLLFPIKIINRGNLICYRDTL